MIKGEAVQGSITPVSVMAGLEWRVFRSSCLPKKFRGEWSFGGLTYQVSGDPDGKEKGFILNDSAGIVSA